MISICSHYKSGDQYAGIPYIDLLEDAQVHFVPMVNPDGVTISQLGLDGIRHREVRQTLYKIYEDDGAVELDTYLRQWKANARGVDLNRNFDALWDKYQGASQPSSGGYKGESPHCEVEAKALVNLTEKYHFERTISYHTQGQVIYWYFGQEGQCLDDSKELADMASALTGYPTSANYQALDPAGYKDWAIQKMGIPSLTIEVGTGANPVSPDQFTDIWKQNCNVVPELLLEIK